MTEQLQAAKAKFPATFWTANTIELFERAAYYAMASFMVIYLNETLGMSPQTATFLNGSILWGLIYFLPILSGTLADKFGFRRSLVAAMILISAGYLAVFAGHRVPPTAVYAIVVLGIVLIGMGGSIVKPCIAGTVQKTAGTRATLAFGIFYMVINIGSLTGRGIAYYVRTSLQKIPPIFIVSAAFALLGLAVVLFIYREPEFVSDGLKDGQVVRKRTLGEAVMGIFTVLGNIKFVFLIVVLAMFWFLYIQLYNLMPLYIRFVDPNAPMDLYTMANPAMIVLFQIPITRFVKRQTPLRSIMLGAIVVTLGMLINALPALLSADPAKKVSALGLGLPIAGVFMLVSIAAMAVGEMMASPRIYEYIGAIAPRGQEGLYLGYQSLPIALASIVGGPLGGRLFERYINTPVKEGRPAELLPMWLIIVGIGVASIIGLLIYDRFVVKGKKKEEKA